MKILSDFCLYETNDLKRSMYIREYRQGPGRQKINGYSAGRPLGVYRIRIQ